VAALRGDVTGVLVVDNASTDDSVARVEQHALVQAGRARLLRMESNLGPCPARNRGLAEARTRWVLQIDSDVIVQPDLLERLWPQTAEPDVVAVQPRAVLAQDPGTVHYDAGSMHYVGVMCLEHLLVPAGAPGPPQDVDAVISMALLLDREAVLGAGAYDPAFFILFEDHDLSYRLRARGLRLRLVPEARVLHREGTRGLSYRPGAPAYPERRAFLHARNRGYLVLKNYGWPALLLSLPGRLLFGATWWVFALRRGVGTAYLRGRLDLLRLVPRALQLRRDLAGRRRVGDRELLVDADLTFSPVITRRGPEAGLERGLSRVLRAWWRCVRWLVPA
jgi:GT2 family glycosyltransferase